MFMGIRMGVPALLGGSFSPATLFATAGSRGFFYDFSDYTAQFTDTAGTTPVTGVGQSLALVLDESQGLVRGPELVTNGDFSSGSTGWTPQTGWTIGSGIASVNSAAAGTTNLNSTSVVVVSGKTYQITYTILSVSGSGIRATIGGVPEAIFRTTTGTFTVLLTASSTAGFGLTAASTDTVGTVDNISVRELPGNHATQATAGSRALTQVRPMFTQRNRALGSELPENNFYWVASSTSNGVTYTRVATGVDTDGLAYADYSVVGTATANSFFEAQIVAPQRIPAATGQTWTVSMIARRLSGAAPGAGDGVIPYIRGETAPSTITETSSLLYNPADTEITLVTTFTLANAATNQVRSAASFKVSTGNTANYVMRVKGYQFELGSTRTTYQPAVSGELRNRAIGSGDVGNTTYWAASVTHNGITATKLASGTDTDGLPYADYSVVGTATAVSIIAPYLSAFSRTPAAVGQTWNASFIVRRLSGTVPPALCGVRFYIQEETAPLTFNGSFSGPITEPPLTDTVVTGSYTFAKAGTNQALGQIDIRTASGATVNYNIRIKAFQFEQNATYSRYQQVVTTNEWYEPGFTSYRGIRFDGADDFLQTAAIDFAGAESLGPELVTNGAFDTSANWNTQAGWAVSGGGASATSVSSTAVFQISSLPQPGRRYSVTYTVSNYVSGSVRVEIRGGVTPSVSSNGTFTAIISGNSGDAYIYIVGLGGFTGTIDNISVREVLIAADKMTVVAGVRKLSDAATAVLLEMSATVGANDGVVQLTAPISAAANYQFTSKGTASANASYTNSAVAAPNTSVLTGLGDISGDLATIRINGTQVATSATDQGTGNYGNYPVYIGRRGGTSLPFNGVLTFLCVINRTLTAAELAQLEAFANSRTGAF